MAAAKKVDAGIQVSNARAVSYNKVTSHITHRKLLDVFFLKESTLDFCFKYELISCSRKCPTCGGKMRLINDKAVSDGRRWYCRVKSGSLWIHGNALKTIHHGMALSSNTDVDWASFCREVCEMAVTRKSVKIGGPGVVVEIDESKFSKRKYNRGHPVKTGWVFGGREGDNKKRVFMVRVPADTLCDLIQQWICLSSVTFRHSRQLPRTVQGVMILAESVYRLSLQFKFPFFGVLCKLHC